MLIKLKIFIYNLIFIKFRIWYLLRFNPLIKSQVKKPETIPIIIINFNQLFYLKQLISFLLERKFENIIVIDNKSTYRPLLEYYNSLEEVKIEYMDDNYGHNVFFKNTELQIKYGQGFYVLTDSDIIPNEKLPDDFMKIMLDLLIKEFNNLNKVGFALDIKNLPDYYALKDRVIKWEEQFWQNKYLHNIESYTAWIDTTFALYKPQYPLSFKNQYIHEAIRMAGVFTAKHGGWFVDHINMTTEQKYYFENALNSNSWKMDSNGMLKGEFNELY